MLEGRGGKKNMCKGKTPYFKKNFRRQKERGDTLIPGKRLVKKENKQNEGDINILEKRKALQKSRQPFRLSPEGGKWVRARVSSLGGLSHVWGKKGVLGKLVEKRSVLQGEAAHLAIGLPRPNTIRLN